ncbi:T9SS type A sorting domain-containing protein [Flavobacteriales bacterium]|nr:T9SS type A sorting domain-containing protein [Flavobacteriales bacterium]
MKKNYFLVSLMLVFISFSGYSQLTAPFVEQFNTTTFPATWNQSTTSGGPWTLTGTMGYAGSTILDHTGTAGSTRAWMDFSGTDRGVIMSSDTIDVSNVPNPEFSFWFNNNLGTNVINPLNLLYVEGYNGTAWVQIDILQQNNAGVWSEHFYDICGFVLPGDKVIVRFRAESGGDGADFYQDLAIDDIAVDTLRVNCFLPQALNVDTSTITISTAVLKWSAGCSDTAWSVKYGLTGFDPLVTGNYVHTNIDSLLVTSLNDVTTYDFYVRSYCNLGDTSTWAGPFTFTTLPLCIAPTNQSISNLTATSVTLRWNAGGGPLADTAWSIVYGATGFALPAGGTYVHVNVDSLNISGLLPVTTYDFYVRGYCNSGDTSAWVGPFTFTTPCSSYVPTYLEDFTSMTFAATPNCWEEGQGLLTVNSSIVMGTSNWGSDVFGNATGASNSAYLNLWTTNRNDWLISPSIDLGTGALPYQVEFDIALTSYANTSATTLGVDDSVTFLISTDNGTTWSDTNILISWNSTTTPISPTGQFQSINLTNAGYTGLVRFAFYCESTASNADNDVFVDNFSVRFVPTCPRPLNLRTSSIYSDSVNLTWDTAATDSIYFLEYGRSGFALGTGTPLTSNTDSTFINGLLPNTTYEVYLRSFCTVGDTSFWTGPFTFTTPCASFTPPYLEDFSTYTFNNNPACWEEAKGVLTVSSTLTVGTSLWTNTAFAHNGLGNIAARMNIWSTNKYEWLLSPSIDLGNGSIPYQVEFDVAITDYFNASAPTGQGGLMGSDDKLVLVISTDNGNTWSDTNILEIWDTANMPSFAGDYFYYDLTAAGYTGEVRFGLYAESSISNEDNDAFVDNFAVVQVPTCPRPYKLTFDSATQTTANLSWTNGSNDISWILEYGAPGFTRGTGTQVSSATNPAVITGLVNSTCYDVYLMSICGAGDSSLWIGPTRFCTNCAPVVDLCEGFENYSAGELPICWSSFLSTTGSSTIGINTFGAYQGTNMVRMNSGSDANATMILVSPEMTALGAGTHRASFWLQGSFNPDTTMIIGTMSDPTNPGTFTPWDTIKNVTTAYQFYRIAFDTYTGTDRHVAFLYPATASFKSMSIDEFCFEVIPTCEKAPFVTVLNPGQDSTTIRLGWNIDTSQVSFFTAYGPTGYDPTTNTAGGDTVTTTNNLQIVNGLNSLTEYCFWVKAICTNGDTSAWSGPFCGSTGCPSGVKLPYFEDFTTYQSQFPSDITPQCWEEAIGTLTTSGGLTSMTESNWEPDGFGNIGFNGAARFNISAFGQSEGWLLSPAFDFGPNPNVARIIEFDVALTDDFNSNPAINGFGADDTVALVASYDGGVTWKKADIIMQWDTSNEPSTTGTHIIYTMRNTSGFVKFGFYGLSNIGNEGVDFFVDNFSIRDTTWVGIDEVSFNNSFKVYPNPNNGEFTIQNIGDAQQSSVKLMDIQGRVVYDSEYYFNENGMKQIRVGKLNAGVYLLLLQSDGKLEQHRIVIQ